MSKTVEVDSVLEGRRLDEALTSLEIAPSRSKVQSLIDDGKVLVNGKQEKARKILHLGDSISYEEYEVKPLDLEKEDIPLNVVYEDEDILIIDKPAGLVVHPGNGHQSGTLVNALLFRGGNLADGGENYRPGLVHRIDKDTSGLLAVAKNDLAFASLSAQLKDHSMHREYRALVVGRIAEDDAKIDAPIGRDFRCPTKFAVVSEGGKEAITYFHVEKRYSNYTLISCRLLTGRTHQIRVHMDYVGHPVEGDPLYGSGNHLLFSKGQLLHAYALTFKHPRTGKEVTFTSPLPQYFLDVLASIK